MTTLSAIVPTRDRPDLLRDCLGTLARQDAPPGSFEVLVVDDGSSRDLRTMVEGVDSPDVPIRYVRQAPAGLNAARNRGAELASGHLLAYLDDDTLVSPGWASAVLDAFDRTGADAVAGRLELRLEGPEPSWLTGHLRSFLTELDLDVPPGPLPAGRLPFGANCAVRRDAFERLGGFRDGLDREGVSLLSNGDVEFFERLRAAGGAGVWWPAAHVVHRVPPERLTKVWFRRRTRAQGFGDGLLEDGDGVLLREVVRAGRSGPILAKGLVTGRGTFAAELWIRYCASRLRGLRSAGGSHRRPAGARR